ncbi:Tubulin-folding cofactor A [Forsythia ovata]|uniref:Tubulin-specific chaperone A n=1 Tax=Forsythia ovata TaxID=205694 RepID=A0ABD1SL68_9LAMI
MATLKNLKIKTSSCERIVKELHSYQKEVEREASKTADMKAKGANPYDLRQQKIGLDFAKIFLGVVKVLLPSFIFLFFMLVVYLQTRIMLVRAVIDQDDEKLKYVRNNYGDEVYDDVTSALTEVNEYNPSGR